MAGPVRAAEFAAEFGFLDPVPVAVRVDLIPGGDQHMLHPERFAQLQVGIEQPGIAGQIVRVFELCRVDVDARDGVGILGDAAPQQRGMAVVQGAHGRHEANVTSQGCTGVSPFRQRSGYLHKPEVPCLSRSTTYDHQPRGFTDDSRGEPLNRSAAPHSSRNAPHP